jgi:hypothetical protein
MKRRYISFIAITTIINIFCIYYTIVFCAIYPHTSGGWAISCAYCLIFKLVIAEIIGPLSGVALRSIDMDRDR